jgi:hypothetical protein
MDFFNSMALQQRKYTSLNPRSYIVSSNQETLVLNSPQLDTRLTWVNSVTSFVAGASCNSFIIENTGNRLVTINQDNNARPHLAVSGDIAASNFVSSTLGPKQIILSDPENSATQFAGLGYTGGGLYYQTPTPIGRHIFQTGITNTTSKELMRIQSSYNRAQVGIGLVPGVPMSSNLTLQVAGTTFIDGDLIVTGNLSNSCNYLSATTPVPSVLLPNNLVYLSPTNKIDDSLLSLGYNFQFLKAQKNVGIGTMKPEQKLHVQGTAAISDRLGVGSSAVLSPAARIHAVESTASIPTMILENNAGGNILQSYALGAPVLFVKSSPSIGVGIGTSNITNALTVSGDASVSGTLYVGNFTVKESTLYNLHVVDSNTMNPLFGIETFVGVNQQPVKTLMSYVPLISTAGVSTNIISPYNQAADVAVQGDFRVTGATRLASAPLVAANTANITTKYKIPSALTRLGAITGYICTWNNGAPDSASLLYQEVFQQLPQATDTPLPPYPAGTSVNYAGVVALLVEAVKELNATVNNIVTKNHLNT